MGVRRSKHLIGLQRASAATQISFEAGRRARRAGDPPESPYLDGAGNVKPGFRPHHQGWMMGLIACDNRLKTPKKSGPMPSTQSEQAAPHPERGDA